VPRHRPVGQPPGVAQSVPGFHAYLSRPHPGPAAQDGQIGGGPVIRHPERDHARQVARRAQLLWRTQGDQASRPQHRDTIREPLRLLQVVGGEQNGGAEIPEAIDEIPGVVPGGRVETGGRFVEKEQLRCSDQAQCEIEAAPLPAGERLHARCALVVETYEVDEFVRVVPAWIQRGLQPDQLADRELLLEAGGLQDHADACAEGRSARRRVAAKHLNRSRVSATVSRQDLHCGRLSGAVRAEQGEDLTHVDRERDAVDGAHRPVGADEVAHRDSCHTRSVHGEHGVVPAGKVRSARDFGPGRRRSTATAFHGSGRATVAATVLQRPR